jgi:hypothetical protein
MKRNGTCALGALQRSNFLRHKHAARSLRPFHDAVTSDSPADDVFIDKALAETLAKHSAGRA